MLYETKEGQLNLINLSMDVGILKQIFMGKVLLHTSMQQLLHTGLCGSKKKGTSV